MSASGGAASPSRGDSGSEASSSLGSFGAELEAELLYVGAGASQATAHGDAQMAAPPAQAAHAAHREADEEPESKRPREGDGAQPAAAGPAPICPPHPGFMHGMCIRCCARKAARGDSDGEAEAEAHIPLSYIDVGLEVSAAEALRLRADEQRRVLSARKLFLVLDLDHTLLNSARAVDLDAASLQQLHTATHSEAGRAGGPQLYELRYLRLWTKLRPGARALLAAAAPLCEVLIYTMGDRGYAVEMARLLDPEGSLLRPGRLIAAQDCTQSGLKDLDVVLGSAEAVLILDDTPGVWRRHAANVIVAERYHYFPCSARGHGGEGAAAWLPRGEDESEEDGTMAALLRLIRRVHAAFFDDTGAGGAGPAHAPPQDVRPLLGAMRAAILHGCVIVFSHVIPLGESAPERHPLWRLATELGAACSAGAREDATHVVAGQAGTEKAHWAAQRGRHAVTPAWLRACGARWERVPEQAYALPPAQSRRSAAAAAADDGAGPSGA